MVDGAATPELPVPYVVGLRGRPGPRARTNAEAGHVVPALPAPGGGSEAVAAASFTAMQ